MVTSPDVSYIPSLKALFSEAFGNENDFTNHFFAKAFSPERSRCILLDGRVAAALYWFDSEYEHGKLAYIYAVATLKEYRGRGLCRELMAKTHADLRALGYVGAVLVPAEPSLFDFYARMDYRICSGIKKFDASASDIPAELRPATTLEYAQKRRELLPIGGVIQENETLDLLCTYATLYVGDGFILAASDDDGEFFCEEFLGDADKSPAILKALGYERGTFKTCGGTPFSMFFPLAEGITPPKYFGIAMK